MVMRAPTTSSTGTPSRRRTLTSRVGRRNFRRNRFRSGSSAARTATSTSVAAAAVARSPTPTVRPMAHVTHIDAAVVRFLTDSLVRKITPAPRKPMPTTTCDATRVTSTLTLVLLRSVTMNSSKPSVETIPKMAAPRQTAMWVRRPAG